MKNEYTIGEICDLYNIGQDSMRYYEKMGLITPRRRNNGYRVYTLDEVWKLNIIKDLRKLNFSVKQIKEYLEDRSIQTTKELIEKESNLIKEEIQVLLEIEKRLERKLKFLNCVEELYVHEKIEIKKIEDRKIILIQENISKDEEVDLALRKLQSKNDEKIFLFGNKNMGAMISKEGIKKGIYNLYKYVFFLLDKSEQKYDRILPAGDYATLTYQGKYKKSQIFIGKMLEYIENEGYVLNGKPIEIYRVDIHETDNEEEFITEIQIPIKIVNKTVI